VDLLASTFCEVSISLVSPLFIFKENCASTLIYFRVEEESRLIESRRGFPSEKHIMTFDLGFLI